jgi:hypothetical protein
MAQVADRRQEYLEALIQKHVEPHPARRGRSEWRLKERGVPVWALIGGLVLTENPDEHPEVLDDDRVAVALGDEKAVAQVARDYGLSDEAMEAAIVYYWRNKRQVDARLITNAA